MPPSPEPSQHAGARRVRVLLACDVRLYREGLAARLSVEPWLEMVGTAATAPEALAAARAQGPEIVLVDMAMAGSLPAVQAMRASVAGVKVVAVGIQEEPEVVVRCAEAGVVGYVPREASVADLVAAIERVSRGELLTSPAISASLMRYVGELAERQRRPGASTAAALTRREAEVLTLLEQGLSNKEIARRLAIGLTTVKNHVHRILEKMQVSGRGAAAAHARGRPRTLEAIQRGE